MLDWGDQKLEYRLTAKFVTAEAAAKQGDEQALRSPIKLRVRLEAHDLASADWLLAAIADKTLGVGTDPELAGLQAHRRDELLQRDAVVRAKVEELGGSVSNPRGWELMSITLPLRHVHELAQLSEVQRMEGIDWLTEEQC